MYKIIGADQKAYGPVSTEQIRQWIAESRINAQTRVQAGGTQEWKPLSEFPEFAELLGADAPVAPSLPGARVAGDREAALKAVASPAMALKVTAILNGIVLSITAMVFVLVLLGVELHQGNPKFEKMLSPARAPWELVKVLIGFASTAVIFVGASRMRVLRSHSFAFTACILAMLPYVSPCCMLGLPFGIWALVVMNKPEVKSRFQ